MSTEDNGELTLPAFLDRKVNGIKPEPLPAWAARQISGRKLIWPKKRNWRKIEERRRKREKREGAALLAGAITNRKGQ